MPKVSIVIPAYNNGRFVGSAVESIFAQTYKDYEVIVVDDGSTDNTRHQLVPYMDRIQYIYQENQERSAARNRGVAESTGEYLAFLDSDDRLLPNKLGVQVDELDRRPEIGLVASGYEFIDEQGKLLHSEMPWVYNPSITLETLLLYGLTSPNAVLMRREWFDRIGGFDPRYQGPEDIDLWCRLNLQGCKMDWVRELVCQYRLHSTNSTNDVKKLYREFYRVVDNLFEERDLPSQISQRKPEFVARLMLEEARKLYFIKDFESAKARMQEVITLLPSVAANDYNSLFLQIVDWQKDFRIKDPDRFVGSVVSNLPFALSSVQKRTLYGLVHKSRFFDAYSDHSFHKIPKLWLDAIRFDPPLFLNRGAWSILVRSIVSMVAQNSRDRQAQPSA